MVGSDLGENKISDIVVVIYPNDHANNHKSEEGLALFLCVFRLNKTKYFRIRLSVEVSSVQSPKSDLNKTYDKGMSQEDEDIEL